MEMIAIWLEMDEKNLLRALQEAGEKLESVQGELVLDFSSVLRLDSRSLLAIEEFTALAADNGVRVVLRGVNVGIYKVLKLVKLASRFSFVN
jgi:ABC-type transporter Mla MlaB component